MLSSLTWSLSLITMKCNRKNLIVFCWVFPTTYLHLMCKLCQCKAFINVRLTLDICLLWQISIFTFTTWRKCTNWQKSIEIWHFLMHPSGHTKQTSVWKKCSLKYFKNYIFCLVAVTDEENNMTLMCMFHIKVIMLQNIYSRLMHQLMHLITDKLKVVHNWQMTPTPEWSDPNYTGDEAVPAESASISSS